MHSINFLVCDLSDVWIDRVCGFFPKTSFSNRYILVNVEINLENIVNVSWKSHWTSL